MDIRSIITPVITDRDALKEFHEALIDQTPTIEREINRLKNTPNDREAVGALFRAIHNIKGDAALCKIDLAVAILHPLETVLARFRNGEIGLSEIVAEALLLALDRLEQATEGLSDNKSLDGLRLLALVQGLEKLAQAKPPDLDEAAGQLVEAVTGFRPATEASKPVKSQAPCPTENPHTKITEDLRFFHTLADQLEARSPLFKGRTLRLLRLALETNQIKDNPVDPIQLEAAVYMHDIGMMFLPESVWLKLEPMTPDEKKALQTHPAYAADILSRMTGWEDATAIVRQHHEMPDGKGYPLALKTEQIVAGAKILAIVDAFEAIMLKHVYRGKNRSVLRAIAEINACDRQFAPEWIGPFNQVIRRSLET